MMKLQPAVRKETAYVAGSGAACTVVMLLVFFVLNRTQVLGSVPFGVPEVVSGVIGWFVASANFFLMALSVQKVASITDEKQAKRTMTVSYRYRTILQIVWAAVTFLVKFFNPAAGIIPLFFPSIMIKLRGGASRRKSGQDKGKEEVKA